MSDLRTAAQQALEALEEYQSKGAPFLACDGAVDALRAALAQQDEQDHNTRAEFERWAASYSTFCLEREDDAALGTAGYKSVEQTMLWHAWQAAKTNAPVGASGGKSGANTRLGLAGADCTHEFAVAATSGISICTKCGLSEMVARKRALRALAQQAEPVQEPEGMVEFLADLQRSRTKYPKNRRMFDGLMGEIDELRRAYAGDGDIRAEAFDVAVCAFRIATEGDAGGNARLEQAEPVSADPHTTTLRNLLKCCLSWEPDACVLGNVTARQAVAALRAALAQRAEPVKPLFNATVVDDAHPNGIPLEQWIRQNRPVQRPQTLDEAMQQPRAMAQAYESGYNAGQAHERKECAKVCGQYELARSAAAAIRARGEQP